MSPFEVTDVAATGVSFPPLAPSISRAIFSLLTPLSSTLSSGVRNSKTPVWPCTANPEGFRVWLAQRQRPVYGPQTPSGLAESVVTRAASKALELAVRLLGKVSSRIETEIAEIAEGEGATGLPHNMVMFMQTRTTEMCQLSDNSRKPENAVLDSSTRVPDAASQTSSTPYQSLRRLKCHNISAKSSGISSL